MWSEDRWKSVVAEYLSSEPYQALERQRAPHKKTMEDFKLAGRSAKTLSEARAVCLRVPAVLISVEESLKINSRQTAFAREFFSAAR